MLKNNDISIPEACYADLCKVGFFERKQVKLTIIWNEKISRNKQILTLKKLYPELNKVSTVEIYKITKKRRNGNLQRWDGDLLHFTELSGRHSVLERPLSEVNGRLFFS